jgi:protein PhnA
MSISNQLNERCQGVCELCNIEPAIHEYLLHSKDEDYISNQVALCSTCQASINDKQTAFHWRCLEGSIWSPEESVQALSYRILNNFSDQSWATDIMSSVDIDDRVKELALQGSEILQEHKDAFGNVLQNGDNVVLTQALDVKGTSFTASKGTVVKKIKLVHDNPEQIEGKINEQMIVILTKYVKKN